MNKRKVLSILLLALITVTLAVSCSGSIDTPKQEAEELAYVTFGNGHSRELSTSYQTEAYGNLYWFYTAIKDDQYGTTGQVGLTGYEPTAPVSKMNGVPSRGLEGQVGPFSQGDWFFTLYAAKEYKTTVDGVNTIYSIDKDKFVYKSEPVRVTLKGNEIKNVPVSVSPQGQYGYVRLDNVTFNWKDGLGGASAPTGKLVFKGSNPNLDNDFEIYSIFQRVDQTNTFTLTGTVPSDISEEDVPNFDFPADFYTVTATAYLYQEEDSANNIIGIDNEGTPLFRQTFGLRVYGNATTVISGDIVEGVNTTVTFDVADQAMRVFTKNTSSEDGSTTVYVAVNPLNGNNESAGANAQENEKTTVSFPAGALADAVHQLDVSVTPIASAEQKFQVSGKIEGKTAVSGIDLSLVKVEEKNGALTQTPVTSFGEETPDVPRKVTVTTYIATGLSNVSVRYIKSENDGSDIQTDYTIGTIEAFESGHVDGYYDSSSGKLVFNTTHFSQFVVVADVEALNVSTGVPYTSLAEAIAAAGNGQEVKVMKNVNTSSSLNVTSNLLLNLNEKKIISSASVAIRVTGNLTLYNGEVEVNNSGSNNSVIQLYDNAQVTINGGTYKNTNDCTIRVTDNSKLIIEDGNFNAQEVTVLVVDNGTAVINGGTYTSNDNFVIGTNGTATDKSYDITINGGTFNGNIVTNGYIACGIYMANRGTVTLNGGTFYINGGVGVLVRSGELIANNVLFNITPKDGLESGKVGDALINIKTPAQIVIDTKANYPGGAPVIAVNKTSYGPKTIDGNSVVTIKNKEQLKNFATSVNESADGVSSTVLLMADIDLAGEKWTPIGPNADSGKKFKGVFHGQNHVIKNMTVDQTSEAKYRAAGFFGALNGTVMNLVFDNASVKSISCTQSENGGTDNGNAIVAGSIYNSGLIKNVTVKNSNVSANRYVGGIAGYVYGNVENCTVENTVITATPDNQWGSYDNGDKVGGIVGYLGEGSYFVKNCSVTNNTITGYRDIGGVVGYSHGIVSGNTISGGTITVDNSHNYKSYTVASAHDANAIVGEASTSASVTNNSGAESVTITLPSYTK